MRRLRKLVTKYVFNTTSSKQITLGSGVRLNPLKNCLELIQTNGAFPIVDDLYAKSRLAKPASMKQAIGFEAVISNILIDGVEVTGVRYRLSDDGVAEYFWDGADWSVAAAGEWNYEEEVADHISSFPMTKRGLQVVVNLFTTDKRYTPSVYAIKILWLSDIEWIEDYIERSFIRQLRSGVQPIADYVVRVGANSPNISLSQIPTKYDIIGVDAAYNLTVDPDKLTDLAASWDSTTKTVTLSTAPSPNDRIYVRFVYSPVIAITTGQDYSQVAKIPAIQIEDVYLDNETPLSTAESVINKSTGMGWELSPGTQADIVFSMRLITDKELDAQRLYDATHGFFDSVDKLTSLGLDEDFTMVLERPYAHASVPGQTGLHGARIMARIIRAVFFRTDAKEVNAVTNPIIFGGGGNLGG